VFVDRLLAALVHLRHAATHDVLACWFGVDRSTITRAIAEVRPLLAGQGCTVSPGVRLRTLAEVIDHLGASGKDGLLDSAPILRRSEGVTFRARQDACRGWGVGLPCCVVPIHSFRPIFLR
jgi:hypothetical protein